MNKNTSVPLYIRMGFFSKKILAIVAFLSLIVDIILPVLMTGKIIEVLQYVSPYWVIISSGVLLFHWAGLKIFSNIDRLFGIDLRSTKAIGTSDNQCQLGTLFEKNSFKPYQKYAFKRLRWAGITIIAAIVAIAIVILTLDLPYICGLDPRANHFPNLVADDFKTLIYFGIIVILSFIWFWILFSGIGTLLLVLSMGWVFGEMDKFDGLTIVRISGIIEEICMKKHLIDFSKETEFPKLSIKRFKRRYDDVPNFLTKISIGISIELFLIVSFTIYYRFLFEAYEASTTVPAYIKDFYVGAGPFLMVLLIMISIILLIIAPQWSFHRLLVEVKESVLDALEELYERKKLQYLETIQQEIKGDSKSLLKEVETLNLMISDVEKISTLPFKENHIITLVSSMILPFIPFLNIIKDIAIELISMIGT